MKIAELTRQEVREVKRIASGRRCDCALTWPDICARCTARGLRELIRRACS